MFKTLKKDVNFAPEGVYLPLGLLITIKTGWGRGQNLIPFKRLCMRSGRTQGQFMKTEGWA